MSCGCRQSRTGELCVVRGELVDRAAVEREITRRALAKVGRGALLDGVRVRWLGAVWRGVPIPLRWVLEARVGLLPRELPDCGCLDRPKAWCERAAAWWRAWEARAGGMGPERGGDKAAANAP